MKVSLTGIAGKTNPFDPTQEYGSKKSDFFGTVDQDDDPPRLEFPYYNLVNNC